MAVLFMGETCFKDATLAQFQELTRLITEPNDGAGSQWKKKKRDSDSPTARQTIAKLFF